ncbi:carbohydrate sulfotransferase 6-like [Microcaecilia unicolor]|uniref:Sulfotransferase n=1 Tax=Microcaecilia unicolor TaxID=1415580 RepID=A0A6P7XKN6_9AMPH|nr:carbohydrate sulfotransferase 6-like [Microcaecilia unicolor]
MFPRVHIFRVCLLILVSALIILYWERQLCPVPDQGPQGTRVKTRLLILSTWRAGSSFVGQLFNQNPDVFYLVEPIWHVWKWLTMKQPYIMALPARNLLKSLFLCNIKDLTSYLYKDDFISDLIMWQESRALCSPPACNAFQRSDIIDKVICTNHCNQVPFQKIEDACRTYSHIVVKAVRFLDLKVLYPLLRDPSLNLTIFHLVRDPRAIFSSRQFISLNYSNAILSNSKNSETNDNIVMQKVCDAQVRIYNAAMASPPPFARDRYRLVRFEDLVQNPLDYVKEWYQALGLTMTSKLQSWVYDITSSHSETIPEAGLLMPIRRVSKRTAKYWREKLSFQKVQEVQHLCRENMEVFGYHPVRSEEELKNSLLELVAPQKSFQEEH